MLVTYSDLLSGVIQRLPTEIENKKEAWRKHVELALELKENLKANRMIIAEIAERSCLIYAGGDRKSDEFKETTWRLTLKQFCKDAGLQYTTVNTWILVKNRVFTMLPEEHRGSAFNLTVAKETGEYFKAKGYFGRDGKVPAPAEVREVYERRVKPSERKMRQQRIMKYLRQSYYYIAIKGNWRLYGKDDLETLRMYTVEIMKALHKAEYVEKKVKPRYLAK